MSALEGRYRMLPQIPSGGHRVRRTPSLQADQVATVGWHTHSGDVITVERVERHGGCDWLKLAEAVYPALRGSASFERHDPKTEGWCTNGTTSQPFSVDSRTQNVRLC